MNTMQINLKGLYFVPIIMTIIFTMHISISFFAIEKQTASYISLAMLLLAFSLAFVLIIREKNISQFCFIIMVLMALIEVISLSAGVAWKDWIYYICDMMLLLFLFHYYRDTPETIIIGATIGFSLCVYMQLLQCITHPEMWMIDSEKEARGYLLGGNYNSIGCRLLCALITNIIALKISKWWWINLVLLTLTCITIPAMVHSMTSLTCILFFLLLCLIPNKKLQRFSIFLTIIGAILFEIFVCFQGKGFENNDLARWFLVEVLGKDLTFTNRTTLWDAALRVIAESPIWGYGNVNEEWFFSKMSSAAVGPHNFILGLLINGGIIALVLYVWLAIKVIFKVNVYKDRYSNAILASIATLFVMMLMEYYPVHFPLYLFTLAYYYQDINSATTPIELQ